MREPKPRYRKDRQTWVLDLDGSQHNLGRDENKAHLKYHQLMANRIELADDPTVCNLFRAYLEFVQKNRAEGTLRRVKRHLSRFAKTIPAALTVSSLKKRHVRNWIDEDYRDHSATNQHDGIAAVVAALNWGLDQDLIIRNPLAGIKKPTPEIREFFIEPDKWQAFIDAIKNPQLRDYCIFGLHSGARPQETRAIEKRHYDALNRRIVFPAAESKGKKRSRIICLDDITQPIIERLLRPDGPLFRNTKGRPWTKDSINCAFRQLKKRLNAPKLCAYTLRHSFAYWKISSGEDIGLVATLMGHTDTRMVMQRYGHIEKNAVLLSKAANRTASPLVVSTTGQTLAG